MSERTVDAEQVRAEHLAEVSEARQWALLVGVMGGGSLLMVALIALLGALNG